MMWLADHSLRVAALVLVVGVSSLLTRRASAHSRLFAWTVVLYLAVAMPLLTAVLPDVPLPIGFSDPVIVTPQSKSVSVESPSHAGDGIPAPLSPWTFPWLLALYLMGTGLLVSRFIVGTHLTARVLHRARPVDDAALLAQVRSLSASLKLRRAPQVVEHESVHVPFVCGVFRPTLVLPAAWGSWDLATRQAVLTHELSHIVRGDLWTLRVASLYCAMTWMNPLGWGLRRRLETLAERASDDEVLASGVEPTAYAEMLVQFFGAAQRAPGRATWHLAMARRGGAEARKRVGRVLDTREGGQMKFGMPGRVLVGIGVALAAVPAVVVSASRLDAVTIRQPPIVDLGLENQAELRQNQSELRTVAPRPRQAKRLEVDLVRAAPVAVPEFPVVAQAQEQEHEPEPWRSTRKGSDADVVTPTLSHAVNPKYTPDAMRAKIQGWVTIEAIVSPEGDVTAARVTKSLDRVFGLDDEALKIARQWQFRPGTYQGQPVALRVIIEMQFTLRRSPSRP